MSDVDRAIELLEEANRLCRAGNWRGALKATIECEKTVGVFGNADLIRVAASARRAVVALMASEMAPPAGMLDRIKEAEAHD